MILFILLGIPLFIWYEHSFRDRSLSLYKNRFILSVGFIVSLLCVLLQIVVASFMILDFSWGSSFVWFMVLDWLLPVLALCGAGFAIGLITIRKKGAREAIDLQLLAALIFYISLLVRTALRLNQLEFQDYFIAPFLVIVFLATVPSASQLAGALAVRRNLMTICGALLFFCLCSLGQSLSHMNHHMEAAVISVLMAVGAFVFRRRVEKKAEAGQVD